MKNVISVDKIQVIFDVEIGHGICPEDETSKNCKLAKISEELHSLLISKLPEKKYIHHVWEGGDNPEDCKRLNKEITAIRDNVIDDMRKSIDELFGVDDE